MSRLSAENEARLGPRPSEEWHGRGHLMEREEYRGRSSWGLLIGGLALIGLGACMAYYLGPDLVRYIKIKRM